MKWRVIEHKKIVKEYQVNADSRETAINLVKYEFPVVKKRGKVIASKIEYETENLTLLKRGND